jgi:hypothetical protein
MAHLAWSIAVKRLAICINSFTEVYIGLAIIELAPVKDADFDHFYHLLSWIKKISPRSLNILSLRDGFG